MEMSEKTIKKTICLNPNKVPPVWSNICENWRPRNRFFQQNLLRFPHGVTFLHSQFEATHQYVWVLLILDQVFVLQPLETGTLHNIKCLMFKMNAYTLAEVGQMVMISHLTGIKPVKCDSEKLFSLKSLLCCLYGYENNQ